MAHGVVVVTIAMLLVPLVALIATGVAIIHWLNEKLGGL